MKAPTSSLLLFAGLLLPTSKTAQAQSAPPASASEQSDGRHDFDFILGGSWKGLNRRLVKPLTGSTTWVEHQASSSARSILGGLGNIEEAENITPNGRFVGLTLRLYNPNARQWSIYWWNPSSGPMGVPTVGQFRKGRGEFYDQESFQGRTIQVRYFWSRTSDGSARFEQSFSLDGGQSWEPNWVTDWTRNSPSSAPILSLPDSETAHLTNGQRDFDFWKGSWKGHSKRLMKPLTGSTEWIEFDATNVTTMIMGGRGFMDEYQSNRPTGQVQGLTLGLFDPKAEQWSLYWWNPASGPMEPPVIGQFKNGRGEFLSQDTFEGRAILVRQLWLNPQAGVVRWEQAFSADGGRTWETNAVSDWVRQ